MAPRVMERRPKRQRPLQRLEEDEVSERSVRPRVAFDCVEKDSLVDESETMK